MKTSNNSFRKHIWVLRGVVLLSIIAIALVGDSILAITPKCVFTSIFDVSCPGCGMTTAFVHLASFEFKAALQAHALVYPIVFVIVCGLVTPISFIRSAAETISTHRIRLVLATFSIFSIYWFSRTYVL